MSCLREKEPVEGVLAPLGPREGQGTDHRPVPREDGEFLIARPVKPSRTGICIHGEVGPSERGLDRHFPDRRRSEDGYDLHIE